MPIDSIGNLAEYNTKLKFSRSAAELTNILVELLIYVRVQSNAQSHQVAMSPLQSPNSRLQSICRNIPRHSRTVEIPGTETSEESTFSRLLTFSSALRQAERFSYLQARDRSSKPRCRINPLIETIGIRCRLGHALEQGAAGKHSWICDWQVYISRFLQDAQM